MYRQGVFAVDDPRALLAGLLVDHAATVVTIPADGGAPVVSIVPLLLGSAGSASGPADGEVVLQGHLARANPHAAVAPGALTVASVVGAQGYITPSWYPSKAEHGRVVPTWDYVAAVATGTIRAIDDPAWLVDLVARLTDRHEEGRDEPWSVADTPEGFVEKQARAIVGIEIAVTSVEATAKLSQNRPAPDQQGVVAGLRTSGPSSSDLATAVERAVGPAAPT